MVRDPHKMAHRRQFTLKGRWIWPLTRRGAALHSRADHRAVQAARVPDVSASRALADSILNIRGDANPR
jgi:hypothetical protein